MALLEARALTVSLELAGQPIEVLRKVSFALAEGRVLGIVGEFGRGQVDDCPHHCADAAARIPGQRRIA